MPRWVLILIVAPLALCVTCASAGYFLVWPRIETALSNGQEKVSEAIAGAVTASVARAIDASSLPGSDIEIQESVLSVNNSFVLGEAGIETGTDGTWVYGFETRISPAGVAIVSPADQEVVASAVPVVVAGRVEFTQVEVPNRAMRVFLSKTGFARGMAEGFNRALSAYGLTPTAITLNDGSLTIRVERSPRFVPEGQSAPDAPKYLTSATPG